MPRYAAASFGGFVRNIEFKAELRDTPLARSIAQALGARLLGIVEQTDTYFRLARDGGARLKRRVTPAEPTEYIEYNRADTISPRPSDYRRYSEEQALDRFGHLELPVWAVVRKVREVYLLDTVRIHIDDVECLGRFIEFEAIVSPDPNASASEAARTDAIACHARIEELRDDFRAAMGEPLAVGYADLLAIEGVIDAR
ncbi:MAG: class IV adenylate cyclase [Phycisphaerales bacterium]